MNINKYCFRDRDQGGEVSRTDSPTRNNDDDRPPLRIAVGHSTLVFYSLKDFSFAVDGRTSVPSSRLRWLMERPHTGLCRELARLKRHRRALLTLLATTIGTDPRADLALESVSVDMVSSDHHWHFIFRNLQKCDAKFAAHKRAALIRYTQYVDARLSLTETTLRARVKTHHCAHNKDRTRLDTLAAPVRRPYMVRLPMGLPIRLHALPRYAVRFHMAAHRFSLVNDDGWLLYDEMNRYYALDDEAHVIGRGYTSDIRLNCRFTTVSRNHLIARPISDHVIELTDLSTAGTFVPLRHAHAA